MKFQSENVKNVKASKKKTRRQRRYTIAVHPMGNGNI